MMHLGYTIRPMPWDGGKLIEVNAFHEFINANDEWREHEEDWQGVSCRAHQGVHKSMEDNPADAQAYTQAVNRQRLRNEIAEPISRLGQQFPRHVQMTGEGAYPGRTKQLNPQRQSRRGWVG